MQPGEMIFKNNDPFGAAEAGWLWFASPNRIIQARTPDEVLPALNALTRIVGAGAWAAGFVAYEAAAGFDPAYRVCEGPSLGALPLLWFGIYDKPQNGGRVLRTRHSEGQPAGGDPNHNDGPNAGFIETGLHLADYRLSHWRSALDSEAYRARIAAIREHIAAGDTYQVNFTYPLEADFEGGSEAALEALFGDLCRAQPTDYSAMLRIPGHAILSASPELFFAQDGNRVLVRPMKGTARRGRWLAEDAAFAANLAADPKERAENLMIVDLLRNDLGRVARTGSVEVRELFRVERYPSLLQMTSTIEAITDAAPTEVFRALFPCGSITGAPKIETMKIIAEMEQRPRGVYCGAIGWIAPGRKARFSVAIRTLQLDLEDATELKGKTTCGAGGGITWDSTAAAEYAETRLKAAPLLAPPPSFRLMEALLWQPEHGFSMLDRHLVRLEDSAAYFDFQIAGVAVLAALENFVRDLPPKPHKIRLLVDQAGEMELFAEAISPPQLARESPASAAPLRLGFAAERVDSADPFLYHKSTRRPWYRNALEARPGLDDLIFMNERGELTESTRANLAVQLDGAIWTPPRESGLLAGTLRDELIASGEIGERILTPEDLRRAEAVWLINSVRGWMRSVVVEFAIESQFDVAPRVGIATLGDLSS